MDDGDERDGKLAIHAYVPAHSRHSFQSYVEELGVTSASALLNLLILREIELERLDASTAPTSDAPKGLKVSTYVAGQHAARFKARASALGRSTSHCAAELVEREVAEEWLRSALRAPSPAS